jgi:hypothetical protein
MPRPAPCGLDAAARGAIQSRELQRFMLTLLQAIVKKRLFWDLLSHQQGSAGPEYNGGSGAIYKAGPCRDGWGFKKL